MVDQSSSKKVKLDLTKLNIIFVLGAPGTGKTTQCKLIARKFHFDYFTIGDLLFHNTSSQSTLQEILNNIVKYDNETIKKTFTLLYDRKTNPIVLIEGFVPTDGHFATWKHAILDIIHIVGALNFHCPEEVMKYRLYNRDECKMESISEIVNVVNSYQCENRLINDLEIDKKLINIETGDSIEQTFKRIQQQLELHKIISSKESQDKQRLKPKSNKTQNIMYDPDIVSGNMI